MKKFLVILVWFLILPSRVNAQEIDYAASYKNYINTYDSYQADLSDYRLAKAQYEQAGTLVSETKAREATLAMLRSRDGVVIAYLDAIRLKVVEGEGLSEAFRNGLIDRINSEIFWFQDHLERLDSAGTLEDLVEDSKEASDRFVETQKVIYDALGTVANGKVTVLRNELNAVLSDTRTKTFEIRSNGDLNVDGIDRWLSEIDEKLTRSLDKSIEAESKVQSLYSSKRSNDQNEIYNEVLGLLEESVQLLRDGSRFMKEILKVFKGEN